MVWQAIGSQFHLSRRRPENMRLAVVTSHPVQYYAPLFRELQRRVDLMVFYGHRAGPTDQAQAGFGVGFHWDSDLVSGYPSTFLENRAKQPGLGHFAGIDTPDIAEHLKLGKFDAVLLIGWHKKFLLQALFAAKRLKLPVMVRGDSHLDTPRSLVKKLVKQLTYPVFLRQFDAALVVGQRNRDYWRHYDYPEQRMFSSPHCVDNEWFAQRATAAVRREFRVQLGISAEVPVALFAGKLIEFKHPQHLLEAAALVRAKGSALQIVIAGDGPLRSRMEALSAELSVPIHLLGFCSQSRMPAVYAMSDVLVLPSNGRETWGLVVNEALACGRPAIVSNAVGCAPDLERVLGKQTSFPFGDVSALADRIEHATVCPAAHHLIRSASDHFSIARAADGVMSAIGTSVGSRL